MDPRPSTARLPSLMGVPGSQVYGEQVRMKEGSCVKAKFTFAANRGPVIV